MKLISHQLPSNDATIVSVAPLRFAVIPNSRSRAAAKRYTKEEADASPSDLQSFIAETVSNGTCKLER